MLLKMFDHVYTTGDLEFAGRELASFAKIRKFDYKSGFVECDNADTDILRRRLSHYESVDGKPTHIKMMMDAWSDIHFGDKWQSSKAENKHATHGFYPFKGKFYPMMIRAILNIIDVKEGKTVLDPYCGCGTLNVEASLMEINSIGVEIVPLFSFVSKTKCDALHGRGNLDKLAHLCALKESEKRGVDYNTALRKIKEGYARSLQALERLKSGLGLSFGTSRIFTRDNRRMYFIKSNSVDAIVCSPPYAIALDYLRNHEVALRELGDNISKIRNKMCGLRGSCREKIKNYYTDLQRTVGEMHRVLKPERFCVIIIGRTVYGGMELKHDEVVMKLAEEAGFRHVLTIRNPLISKNTMSVKYEYVLFFRKI